mmetsp:Transcript_32978/g.94717  ORF Transcript_32978/g.94717 Transcript_32978/m.94717 type:complete len:208 (-) Transcript_32978:476-1099(-)
MVRRAVHKDFVARAYDKARIPSVSGSLEPPVLPTGEQCECSGKFQAPSEPEGGAPGAVRKRHRPSTTHGSRPARRSLRAGGCRRRAARSTWRSRPPYLRTLCVGLQVAEEPLALHARVLCQAHPIVGEVAKRAPGASFDSLGGNSWVNEVHESIAEVNHLAAISRHVHSIVRVAETIPVQRGRDGLLGVLESDPLQHYCGALVASAL